ncbi:MAG: hypothetical protein ACT4OX_13910 [Actinomycetota bacterium]
MPSRTLTWYAAPLLVGAGATLGVLFVRNAADPVATEVPGSRPIVAQPAPAVPPEPVAAEGECGVEMAAVRVLIELVPAGSLLDPAQNQRLTAGLATVDAACSADLAEEFRTREVVPWLTYLPPDS